MATESNKVEALKVMGKYRDVIDIQQGGEHGRTALHLAAIYDHEECARILVSLIHYFLQKKIAKSLFFIRSQNSMHVQEDLVTMDTIQYMKQLKMLAQKQWKSFFR